MTRSLLLLLGTITLRSVCAQQEALEADRPDQTESPAIVPTGWYQFEGGWVRDRSSLSGSERLEQSAPATLNKVGLAPWVELRVIIEHTRLSVLGGEATEVSGLLPVEVGAKFKLLEEHGAVPRTSLIGHVGLPFTACEAYRPPQVFGNFRFTMQHTLGEGLSLGYNLGAEWDGERPTATGVYTLTAGMEVVADLGVYVEAYGCVNDVDAADSRLDGGVTYHVWPDLMLDVSGGLSLGEERWFMALGLSFRVPVFARRTVGLE